MIKIKKEKEKEYTYLQQEKNSGSRKSIAEKNKLNESV